MLFWSLIFSSFLKVNAATDTIDLVAYHRGCIADAEARMVQIVNNIKSAYSRGQGNVINYDKLNNFFLYLRDRYYFPISYSNSTVDGNKLLMNVYFYDNQDAVFGSDDDRYGDISTCYLVSFCLTPNDQYIIYSYYAVVNINISYYQFLYRSQYVNDFLKENSYESSVPSNSELIRQCYKCYY